MALPPRLWLPDGIHEQLTASLSPPAAPSRGAGSSAATPVQRLRRRALWRGEAGLLDRPVLVEWFPASELLAEQAAARRVRGLCHIHLLRLLDLGTADHRTAYAISEAPDGVDLFTVLRAAPGELPPWWGLAIAQAMSRALAALLHHQERMASRARGHGRIGQGTVFVGWDGSIRLFAFSPVGSAGNRQEESIAPELRLSERLLTPAADVYAIGALLRQLLPQASQKRPAIARLIRRCLHPQADQRIGVRALDGALEALLLDQAAPKRRAQAIGDVLGQCCPRATVDLIDTDWGESTGEGFPALPPTLVPLSASTVPLSPTWLPKAAPTTKASRLPAFASASLVAASLLLALLWLGAARPRPPLSTARPPLPQPLALSLEPPRPVEPAPARPALSLRSGSDWLAVDGIRLSIERLQRTPSQLSLLLSLSNPAPLPRRVDLGQLRLVAPSPLLPPLSPLMAPPVTVGAGRSQRLELRFALPEAPADWQLTLPLRDSANMQK